VDTTTPPPSFAWACDAWEASVRRRLSVASMLYLATMNNPIEVIDDAVILADLAAVTPEQLTRTVLENSAALSLIEAYFVEGLHIGHVDVLADLMAEERGRASTGRTGLRMTTAPSLTPADSK